MQYGDREVQPPAAVPRPVSVTHNSLPLPASEWSRSMNERRPGGGGGVGGGGRRVGSLPADAAVWIGAAAAAAAQRQ